MAMTLTGIALSIAEMFANIRPATDTLQKLGAVDFSSAAPGIDIKPNATIKVPLSSISAASAFNTSTNHYGTGGTTTYGDLTATHYLQGFDLSGEDLDKGVNAARMKNLFARRAGGGIAMAVMAAVKTGLDAVTASTAVTLNATMGSRVVADYLNLAGSIAWLDKTTSVLAVNGATLANIKSLLAALNVTTASLTELAQYLGFKDIVLVPGMTASAVIVPAGGFGSIARVPAIVADYAEAGTETDPESGLSVGIVVNNDRNLNRQIVNADLWFGVITQKAPAAAGTSGCIKIT